MYIVHAAVGSNTYAIYGQAQTKDLTELVPQGILNQLGPDAMAQLKRLAEQIQQQQGGAAQGGQGIEEGAEADDEEVPELVEATPTAGGTDEDKTEVSAHIEAISLQSSADGYHSSTPHRARNLRMLSVFTFRPLFRRILRFD